MASSSKMPKLSLSMKKKPVPSTSINNNGKAKVRCAVPSTSGKAKVLSDIRIAPPKPPQDPRCAVQCKHSTHPPPPLIPIASAPSLPLLDDQYSVITINSDDESGGRTAQIRTEPTVDAQLAELLDAIEGSGSSCTQNRIYPPLIRSPSPAPPLLPAGDQHVYTTTTTMAVLPRGGKNLDQMLQLYGVGGGDPCGGNWNGSPSTPKQVAEATYASLLKMAPEYEKKLLDARAKVSKLVLDLEEAREEERAIDQDVKYLNNLIQCHF
ncbi:uncharacterized protein LOC116181841 [Photinus pyralis]|uniref:uncharacterized protein LOC116181841 n=1 Tax=Photinus pyralis TaxID=7054 RepID=UPI0012670F48|nr:uncharacterized protein LOC116181841 [Photinus pyralis]